jgi:glyoxylase-like metal-dependent hydrolase (beta-lactamase superfamily II)
MTPGISVLDVNFQGRAGAVACGLLRGARSVALVDPGPSSSLEGLRAALNAQGSSLADVRAILVTHIHLDHSGGAGTIVREYPDVKVYVHERGAPHMVDSARLVLSASRIYGNKMDRLWGEVAPIAAGNVHAIRGGERIDAAGRMVDTLYTPGHAVHHASYLDVETRTAFTGDVGGMCIGPTRLVVAPTPPPDIDVEAWEASIALIREWRPRALVVAHFGLVEAPDSHLDQLVAQLRRMAELVRASLAQPGDRAEHLAWFKRAIWADLRQVLSESQGASLEGEIMLDDSWYGLARYWRQREGGSPRA